MGIRVLHVLHSFRPGGMENMVAQMASRLRSELLEIEIVALTSSDGFRGRLPDSVRVFELNKKAGIDLECVANLAKLVAERSPSVIHTHNWNSLVYTLMASVRGRVPILHGEHALLYQWERKSTRLLLRRLFYAWCDRVHTVSKGQARELEELGLLEGVDFGVISNGVDAQKFSPRNKDSSRASLGLPKDTQLVIGMVARCVPEKRHGLMIKAFEKLAAQFPSCVLVFSGAGGPCEAEIREKVKTHPFSDRIVWLGHREDMCSVYNALDLLVLPSSSEGMSNVSLEAMSCGVPVLMHDACGSEELIREGVNGFKASLDTVEELALALSRILTESHELQRLGQLARTVVLNEYSLDKTASEYARAYSLVASKK